jgi:drug/metabolite transporter (DMT)-like permease
MTQSLFSDRGEFGLFLLMSAIWGGGFVAISFGLDLFPPVLYAALRYDIAAVVMGVFAVWKTDSWRPSGGRDWLAIATSGVFIVAIDNTLLFLGQRSVTSAVASIVVALTPILAAGFARGLLPDEPITRRLLGSLALGILGVGALAGPSVTGIRGSDAIGVLLILGATTSVAFGSVLVGRLDGNISPAGLTAWSNVVGAVLLHLTSAHLFGETIGTVEWTGPGLLALAYLGVLSSGVGPFLYFVLLDRVGPVRSNLVSYAVPVFAAGFGWALLREPLTGATVVGFVCVLAGFALVARD